MIRDEKGFVSFGLSLSILIATFLMIGIFISPILNSALENKKSFELNSKYTVEMNILERIHSLYSNNVSYNKNIDFEDFEAKYTTKEISSKYKEITVQNPSNNFFINNYTDLETEVQASLLDPKKIEFSYDVNIYFNDKIVEIVKVNSSLNSKIITPGTQFYNEEKNETNYGNYRITISNLNNVSIKKVETKFSKLEMREVLLNRDNENYTVEINNKNDKVLVKMKGGN